MNKDNLIKNCDRTPEELRAMTRKGGINSGKSRRRKKEMKEQLKMLLELPLKNENLKNQINELGIKENEINNQMALTISIFNEALHGNIKAYEIIRDTIGEKPVEVVKNINPPKIKIERPKNE